MTPNLSSSPLSTAVPCSAPSALPEACSEGSHAGWPTGQANQIDDPCARALMLGLPSQHSCCLLQSLPERHASETLTFKSSTDGFIPGGSKVSEGHWQWKDACHYRTHPRFLKKMRQRNSRVVRKVVSVNKCILTESSDRGDSILVKIWCPAWSPARTSRKLLQMYFW